MALVDDSGKLSCAQLESRALSLAEGLRMLGLRKGDLIVTLLPETREQLEGRLAAFTGKLCSRRSSNYADDPREFFK